MYYYIDGKYDRRYERRGNMLVKDGKFPYYIQDKFQNTFLVSRSPNGIRHRATIAPDPRPFVRQIQSYARQSLTRPWHSWHRRRYKMSLNRRVKRRVL